LNTLTNLLLTLNSIPALLLTLCVVLIGAGCLLFRKRQIPLLITVVLVFGVACLGMHLYFALTYLQFPGFLDHIEPNTASVSQLFLDGLPVYHDIDAATRYSFLYGPLIYMVNGISLIVFGATNIGFKSTGVLALVVCYLAVFATIYRGNTQRLIPLLVGLAYFAAMALFYKNYSFWSKPDSLMTAFVALGALSCTLRSRNMAALALGICVGCILNTKLHGAAYLFPVAVWQLSRTLNTEGFVATVKPALIIGISTLLIAAAPFLLFDNISLSNYILWLRSAGAHGLSGELFLSNARLLAFAAIPLIILAFVHRSSARQWLAQNWLTAAASGIAVLAVLFIAAKPGSGPHHLLPFMPLIAIVVAYGAPGLLSAPGRETRAVLVGGILLSSFLITASSNTLIAGSYMLRVVANPTRAADINLDLERIMAEHPGQHVYMGYGSTDSYAVTFSRTLLSFAGQPYLLDASSLMDMQFSGLAIPSSTQTAMNDDKTAVWLIPKGDEPFSIINWYYRNQAEGALFEEGFRENFRLNFVLSSSTKYFDLYLKP
jgi:hypothetical protein